jgi:hypothetical protein
MSCNLPRAQLSNHRFSSSGPHHTKRLLVEQERDEHSDFIYEHLEFRNPPLERIASGPAGVKATVNRGVSETVSESPSPGTNHHGGHPSYREVSSLS